MNIMGAGTGVISAIVGVLAIIFVSRNAGKKAERAKQNEKVLKDVEKSQDARAYSLGMHTTDQLNELRDDARK